MLRHRPVADISLRELSDGVGLAKSNVLRYFDSREAIFLEVMNDAWTAWLDEVEADLGSATSSPGSAPYAKETWVASTIATSLLGQPLLCELISVMGGVLEKNISIDFARTFKQRATTNTARLAQLVRAQLPDLSADATEHFAGAVFVIVAGIWPYATPSEAVTTVMAEMSLPTAEEMFTRGLTEGLVNQLVGLSARQ